MRKHVHFYQKPEYLHVVNYSAIAQSRVLNQLSRIFESKIGVSGTGCLYLLKHSSHSTSKAISH